MRKKKKQISMEANRFKNVSELIKSFEEYSGFSIDPEEIDTRDKLLDKISEIQDYLSNEVSNNVFITIEQPKLIRNIRV